MNSLTFKQECARKAIHLTSLWIPLSIWLLGSRYAALLMVLALGGVVLFEILRRKDHAFGQFLQRLFAPVLRSFEISPAPLMTGAAFMLIGAVATTVLFPADVAIAALSVLMVSDTCAALIGKSFGKHPLFGKSVEGSLAFLVSAILITCLIGLVGMRPYSLFVITGGVASIVATAVELFTKRIGVDDNLSIPISFALTQTLLLFCFA